MGRDPEVFLLHVLRMRAERRSEVVKWMVKLGILGLLALQAVDKG